VTVAHLGTLRPYKGFDTVVEAFAGALEADPGLRLRVVGRAADEAGVRRLVWPRSPAGRCRPTSATSRSRSW
jgi:hypothetical protein